MVSTPDVQRKTLSLIVVILLLFSIKLTPAVSAIDISVSSDWLETIDGLDLQNGAGSELKSTYESPEGSITLNLSNTQGPDGWRVFVRREGGNWPAGFTLSIKRTFDGQGGTVSGGTSYQELTTTDQEFFSGTGNVSGIKVRLRVSGISLATPMDIYDTAIVYTVSKP